MTDLRLEVLRRCVDAGLHPNCNGWFMKFDFGAAVSATVVFTEFSHGVEVGVRRGDWLVEHYEDMTADEVFEKLVGLMTPPSAFGHFPQMKEHHLGEEERKVLDV